jgi:hypothetical protein
MKLTKTIVDPAKLNRWHYVKCDPADRDRIADAAHRDAGRTARNTGEAVKAKTEWIPGGVRFRFYRATNTKDKP